jgi:flagellar basal-body rod modification protein FlgD
MAITAVNTQNVPSSENLKTAAVSEDVLGKDDFLTLLVAQLQNQDPLNPMESTEFTAQLAQFSSLEQLYNVNDNLSDLGNNQLAMNNAQAVTMIGKSAWAYGNVIQQSGSGSAEIHFGLGGEAQETMVNIYSAEGDFVRTIEAGALNAGEHSVSWDGINESGQRVPDGYYQFEVLAGDVSGARVPAQTFIVGKVTGVTFDNGMAQLLINDLSIPMRDVVHVADTDNTEETQGSILTFFK